VQTLESKNPWMRSIVIAGLLLGSIAPAMQAQEKGVPLLPLKVNLGEKAPDFELQSASGERVRLSDYAGHNVLIDFYRGYW
jgi:cytochrome oxidase Cu insertion factor (SCO1/SenC/PrrC family)